ncbi:acetyltransferase, GNAT family [Geomicrobium sp. JCM 19037]|nr:acetyltransferase, GNAT family [Geomicrobium sp. JCM 19037]
MGPLNPLLLDFPQQFETDRLLLRLPLPGDGEAVYDAIRASKSELKRWLPFAQKECTLEDVELDLREAHINFLKREDLRFLLFRKDTSRLVGVSGLHRIDWAVRKFEIGYWVDTRQRGQGYISEAVAGITQFAFDQLRARRVEIRCDRINQRSRAIPEKAGFMLEGILRNDDTAAFDPREMRDTCVYAKISKEVEV